ncbi:MAG: hypothetical protein U0165_09465 [Polyangiaceae bacterium]
MSRPDEEPPVPPNGDPHEGSSGGGDGLDREALIEAAAGAYRARDPYGSIRSHPAWHDLDEEGRREAFERARKQRALEAALDSEGLSTTAKAILSRLPRR